MLPLAHFTAAELPGSVALLLTGIALGAIRPARTIPTAAFVLAPIIVALIGAAAVADPLHLPQAWKLALDATWLVLAAVCAWTIIRAEPRPLPVVHTGTITGDRISTNEITAERLSAGTITADALAAGAV